MTNNQRQIADPDMLVRLHKSCPPPVNILQRAADSVLEDIWCGPKDAGQVQEGWGACASCFDYKMLFQSHCLTCSLAVS